MLKIKEMYIPKSNTRNRPQTKMKPTSITIHETDNNSVGANAYSHAKLQYNGNRRNASWHISIDENNIYQSIPFNEISYHAGTEKGNYHSISIEMTVNSDNNYLETVNNTIELVKYLMKKYPHIKINNVVQHNHWSGKNCPRKMRAETSGITWNEFKNIINDNKGSNVNKPKKPTVSVGKGNSIVDYLKGQNRDSSYKYRKQLANKHGINNYTGTASENTQLLKKLKGGKKPTQTKTGSVVDYLKSQSRSSSFGARVKLARQYGIKNYTGTSKQNIELLNILQGSKKPTQTTNLKVGNYVRVNKSASNFATGESILNSVKGKKYKIIQVKSDRVLLDKVMSWFKKSDVS